MISKSPAQFSQSRKRLWALLGDLPDRDKPVRIISESISEECDRIIERLLLDLNGIEPVPAIVVKPVRMPTVKLPVLLYHHAHCADYGFGKREFTEGRTEIQNPPYADCCIENGWIGVAIDCWNFGERHRQTESSLFKQMLWNGQVLWGMMIFDAVRTLDYICSREDTDTSRIATIGLSMGSTLSWWLAALDERVKVCVDICCLTDYEALIEAGGLDLHGIYYYVPGLLKQFSSASINAMIAPRPHLSLAGTKDPLTPVPGLDRIDTELKQVYGSMGAPEAWKLARCDSGHSETAQMRQEIISWIHRWL
jgi:dienelactone hydrolase